MRAPRGGEWLVRIEDVDEPRARPGAESAILAHARRATASRGTAPSCGNRSARALYDAALATAARARARLSRAPARAATSKPRRSAPAASASIRAPAATAFRARSARTAQRAWRVRVGDARIAFVDRLQGAQRRTSRATSAISSSGAPTACSPISSRSSSTTREQGITDVVRGADLLASTPRQIYLQRLLGLPTPSYLHVPVAINAPARSCPSRRAPRRCRDDPLPALLAAWRFLDQPLPEGSARRVRSREFWALGASRAWNPARLPPVPMLPAPPRFEPARRAARQRIIVGCSPRRRAACRAARFVALRGIHAP